MKLTFIRADHEVTGSCTLLEIGGHYGLIDCGMEQGRDLFENIAIPVPAAQIEFVLVTHAHMDHTGHLPLLYKQGFRGTVYATEATCDLCGIMLRDAAHIQMSEAEWKGRKAARAGQPAPEPLYTLEDVEGVLRLLRPCGYGKRIQVGENIIIRFTDVGHLLGSACIEAWLTEGGSEKKIVFSGDIGNTDQPIIRDPQTVSGADYVLIESTYGDRSHGPRVDYLTALADCIQRTLDRGGNVVIRRSPSAARRSCCISSARSRTPAWYTATRTSPCMWTARSPTRPRAFSCRRTQAFSTTRPAHSSAAVSTRCILTTCTPPSRKRTPWRSTPTRRPRSSSPRAACVTPAASVTI